MKAIYLIICVVVTGLFSCSRRYVPEPMKIPDEVKTYPDNIEKQGKDYVYRSGFFMWNREKQEYEYVPAEWVAQKNGYRFDPGNWQKAKQGYKYRPARWKKVKQDKSRPRME